MYAQGHLNVTVAVASLSWLHTWTPQVGQAGLEQKTLDGLSMAGGAGGGGALGAAVQPFFPVPAGGGSGGGDGGGAGGVLAVALGLAGASVHGTEAAGGMGSVGGTGGEGKEETSTDSDDRSVAPPTSLADANKQLRYARSAKTKDHALIARLTQQREAFLAGIRSKDKGGVSSSLAPPTSLADANKQLRYARSAKTKDHALIARLTQQREAFLAGSRRKGKGGGSSASGGAGGAGGAGE
jgi:hypothetical protein